LTPEAPGGRPDLTHRRLYLCTASRPDADRFVAACIRGGVDVVQLREKSLEARDILRTAGSLRTVCGDVGVPFVLNDRPDLALEAGADGVHVGQEDAPPGLARRILGQRALVGLSTHSEADLRAASHEPVDYISAGPVQPTPTKPGRPGTGIAYAALAARQSPVPVWVTGGVTPDSVPELVNAGLRHFVVVRYLTESDEPERAARRLRRSIDDAIDDAIARAQPASGINDGAPTSP
jgi:thiamine-phosphate pyrophosphorylase